MSVRAVTEIKGIRVLVQQQKSNCKARGRAERFSYVAEGAERIWVQKRASDGEDGHTRV